MVACLNLNKIRKKAVCYLSSFLAVIDLHVHVCIHVFSANNILKLNDVLNCYVKKSNCKNIGINENDMITQSKTSML